MAKSKALISYAVTTQLIFVFVFANAKSRFSNDESRFIMLGLHTYYNVLVFGLYFFIHLVYHLIPKTISGIFSYQK